MRALSGSLTLIVSGCVLFGAIFGVLCGASPAQAEEQCFVVQGSAWGGYCDADPASLELDVKNVCPKPMYLLYCLEQEGGAWDCKVHGRVSTGDAVKVYSCKNTGRFKVVACEDDYDCEAELKKVQ